MLSRQQAYGSIIAGGVGDYLENSGQLSLGSLPNSSIQSFTGNVAWIHGFTYHLTSENLLAKEIEQTWISRLPPE